MSKYLKNLLPSELKYAVDNKLPLLVPAGCIETHGPHLPIGYDTLIVESICEKISEAISCVIAPPFDFGPTGYALGGPEDGTIDPDYDAFSRYAKSILANFIEMGFHKIYVIIQHQGMDFPLALAFKKAASELSFERILHKGYPRGWWANLEMVQKLKGWERKVEVHPMVLPEAIPPAETDHAGFFETSFLLSLKPELVDQSLLSNSSPWYCSETTERTSMNANQRDGDLMVDATVNAWVDKLKSAS